MTGAIIGDVVGSVYEFSNIKTKDFPILTDENDFTDDSIMTIAVAEALLDMEKGLDLTQQLIFHMQKEGRAYPCPMGSYGGSFSVWLRSENPQPYNSWGNGSAMRVSPVGDFAPTLEDAIRIAETTSVISHDHPEGIRGAQATASAVWMAKHGCSKEDIRKTITERFHYDLDRRADDIRKTYHFDASCQGTVPEAIIAFLESTDFEDAIRTAVSLGGDTDTLTAITGSIAWPYYLHQSGKTAEMADLEERVLRLLPADFQRIVTQWEMRFA